MSRMVLVDHVVVIELRLDLSRIY